MSTGVLISVKDGGISQTVKSIVENDGHLTAYLVGIPPNIKDLEKSEIRGAIFDWGRFYGKENILTDLEKMGKPFYILENKIKDYDGVMGVCKQIKKSD